MCKKNEKNKRKEGRKTVTFPWFVLEFFVCLFFLSSSSSDNPDHELIMSGVISALTTHINSQLRVKAQEKNARITHKCLK